MAATPRRRHPAPLARLLRPPRPPPARRAPRHRCAARPQRTEDPPLPARPAAAQRPRSGPPALRSPAPRLRLKNSAKVGDPAWRGSTLGGMENEKTGPSFGARIIAANVLAVAAWIPFKV